MNPMLELHRLVRNWAETGLANKLSKMLSDEGATLAYIDLFFAFGLARLGEADSAERLVGSARRVLDAFEPAEDRGIVARLLLQGFRFRIDQVFAGRPHAGVLETGLLKKLEAWRSRDRWEISPEGMAQFAVQRMRERSRILEPDERINQYAEYMRCADKGAQVVASLSRIDDPDTLAKTVRELYRCQGSKEPDPEYQFRVLFEALPLATRVGESFAAELLDFVRDVLGLMEYVKINPDELVRRQGELLDRAFALAVRFDHRERVRDLAHQLVELLEGKPEELRPQLSRTVVGTALRGLRACELGSEIETLVMKLDELLVSVQSLVAIRRIYHGQPARKGMVLESLLGLASGWSMLSRPGLATPILERAQNELIGPDALPMDTRDYASLARAYISALSDGTTDTALQRIVELFRKMNPERVNSTFTTCKFYSVYHLNIAEEAVFAACRLLGGSEVGPVVV